MAEYIERETVRNTIKAVCEKYNQAYGGNYGGFGEELAKSIDNMPTADVVEFAEVVRCEDCYYYDRQNDYCDMFDFDPPSDTFYCRDGDRKENEVEE